MSAQPTPIPAHLGAEFLTWLWWTSETTGGRFELPQPVGTIDVWVDDRLAFRQPSDTKITAVMTGENPAHALEARAALAGGKVLQDLRLGIRRDDREFFATLKGPGLDVGGLKLPQVLSDSQDEVVFDRMFLYEEFHMIISGLFRAFSDVRGTGAWRSEVVPAVRTWLVGREG